MPASISRGWSWDQGRVGCGRLPKKLYQIAQLLIGHGEASSIKVLQVLSCRLEFLVALVPGFSQLLPRFKLLGLGGVRKPETFQSSVGAREPRFRFVQYPDNVLAGYVSNSVHTQLDVSGHVLDSAER